MANCREWLENKKDPEIKWKLVSRKKLIKVTEAKEKINNGKAICRIIWIPDMEESAMGRFFLNSINNWLSNNPNECKILCKFNRIQDSAWLIEWADRMDYIINADKSAFDSTLSTDIILKAFETIETMIIVPEKLQHIWGNIKQSFIYSRVILPNGDMYETDGTTPSGSILTSTINSISNYIINHTAWKKMIDEYGLDILTDTVTNGDDSVDGVIWNNTLLAIQ